MVNPFQKLALKKLFAMPTSAKQVFDDANATFRAAVRTVADVQATKGSEKDPTAEQKRSEAAEVVNAAFERVLRVAKTKPEPTKPVRKTAFDEISDPDLVR